VNLASIIEPHDAASVALISRGHVTTYGELRDDVAGLRGGLVGLGIEAGDRVGILCANNWYFVSSYLAILGIGAVAVPLNPLSPARELERELAAVGVRAVMVGPSGARHHRRSTGTGCPPWSSWSTARARRRRRPLQRPARAEPVPLVSREDDDLAVLIFTSGTAGSPKAAMLSHGNLLSSIDQVIALRGDGGNHNDVGFGVLPLFHIFGLNVVLGTALKAGASVVLVERFDPSSAVEAIQ
jgi:long-chain acyl-CoA synthetase